ncbi:S-locus-specific glycoprotein S6 [Hibiscus syriacus]|uniref:S-locus-specific glycoprotein S6 n=1 Tax=Hibiscus syriacus TaxID=106335 RepID=A0A6A3B1J3_HIBSY|nr:S-locus-specific glycoprotein S6 [Hibiscus syriacus]
MKTNNKNKNPVSVFLSSLIFLLSSSPLFCHGVDIIRPGDTVKDGETLLSEYGIFELGFFSPENSSSRYIGIWYEVDVKAVVWLANRDKPISDRNGVLRIGFDDNLIILDGNSISVWSSNVSGLSSNNTAAYIFACAGIDPNGGPQVVIWDPTRRRWRSGQWNSVIFTGVVNMSNVASVLYGFKLSQADENRTQYFTYDPLNPLDLLRFRISWDGFEQQLRWDDGEKKWTILLSQPDPANRCDLYNYCGNYATCDNFVSQSTCNCLQGFRPKFPDQWTRGNWSGGCEWRVELQCQRTNGTAGGNGYGKLDGFKQLVCMKFPDLANLWLSARSLDAIERSCLGNCSYDRRKIPKAVIFIVSLLGAFFLVVSLWLLRRYKKDLKVSSMACCKDKDPEGDLPGGQEIAVKRLSGQSGQGLEEFKNEIILIAKLQHRNLVRLLGCSIQGEEKMLIYEYMPNKSLNDFLFGQQHLVGCRNESEDFRLRHGQQHSLFSVKSDVYSFGVLLLEIAWQHWNEDKAMEIVDPSIRDSCSPNEVLKCIHIGMLCVQDSVTHRPTKAAVVLMLESEAPTLPMAREATFSSMRSSIDGQYVLDGASNSVEQETTVGCTNDKECADICAVLVLGIAT